MKNGAEKGIGVIRNQMCHRHRLLIIILSSITIFTGVAGIISCAEKMERTQIIMGIMSEGGVAKKGVDVRYKMGSYDSQCSNGIEGVTDEHGWFSVKNRLVSDNDIRAAVVVGYYQLCIKRDGDWDVVWASYGGGLEIDLIEIECDLLFREPNQSCRYSFNRRDWIERGDYSVIPKNIPEAESKLLNLLQK